MADRRYRVIVNRAAVLDAPTAIYGPVLRPDTILGYLPYGTEISGPLISAPINPDLTAHAIQIAYPLDRPPHAGVIAYVLRSQLDEVVLHAAEVIA